MAKEDLRVKVLKYKNEISKAADMEQQILFEREQLRIMKEKLFGKKSVT